MLTSGVSASFLRFVVLPMSTVSDQRPKVGSFLHEAFLYSDLSDLLDLALSLGGRPGLDPPMLLAVSPEVIEPVQEEMGEASSGVRFLDMGKVGRNPTRMIPLLLRFTDEHPDQPVVIVSEPIWPGRSPAEYATAVQTEALCNVALEDRAATMVCAYHVAILDGAVMYDDAMDDAVRTHPVVVGADGEQWESLRYTDPIALAAECLHPLPDPPTPPKALAFDTADLYRIGQFVTARAARAGVQGHRLDDLEFAVTELAIEILARAGGPAHLRIWQDRNTLACEIYAQRQLGDPLAGRRPAKNNSPHGLLLANELCELLQIDAHPSGTTVRLHTSIHS